MTPLLEAQRLQADLLARGCALVMRDGRIAVRRAGGAEPLTDHERAEIQRLRAELLPLLQGTDREKRKQRFRDDRDIKRELDAEERGAVTFPESLTLSQLLAEPDEPTPWRIAECQPKDSRVICAAQFKAGKTTLVGNLIRSLRDGDPFLGKYVVTPIEGTVALLDFEMGRNQLRRWYRDQQIKNDDGVVVLPMRGLASSFNIIDPRVRAEWVERLRALGVVYLIIDCLRPILDALGLDEHHDVGAFLVPLDALLVEAGIPDALIVHHMGHTNERSRGDSRLRDWPDVEWRLMRKDDDPASARFFTAYGRDVDVEEQELGYDATTRRLSVVGGSRRDTKIDDALPAVLTFIESCGAQLPSRNEILRALKESGHAKNVISAAIKKGIANGQITTTAGTRGAQLHSIITDVLAETEL